MGGFHFFFVVFFFLNNFLHSFLSIVITKEIFHENIYFVTRTRGFITVASGLFAAINTIVEPTVAEKIIKIKASQPNNDPPQMVKSEAIGIENATMKIYRRT